MQETCVAKAIKCAQCQDLQGCFEGQKMMAHDMLSHLVDLQAKFNSRFGVELNLNDGEKLDWLMKYQRCIVSEADELLRELPWKHWKQYDEYQPDWEAIKGECIDILIFTLALFNTLGMSGEDVFRETLLKQHINDKRQEEGY